MKIENIKRTLSKHKGKALIGAGLIPVVYLAWKKRGAILSGVKGLKERVFHKKKVGDEANTDQPASRKLSDSRKTDLVNTVRFMLSKYDTEPFSIMYGRSRKQGYMGYYIRTGREAALFFGWSEGFEERYALTPFWIALNPPATEAFKERELKLIYDIYVNPKDEHSILIPVMLESMEDPQAVAGKIMELARKTLL